MIIKIEYLREFLVLAQRLNYTTASENLYISQSVLSRHIAFIEEEIGTSLVNRSTQPLTLTNAGIYFKEQCEKMLILFDRACNEARLRGDGHEINMKIGIPYYSSNDFLGPFLQILRETVPDMEVSVLSTNPDQCLNALYWDEVDAVMITRMNYPNSAQLEFQNLYKERLAVFVNMANPLAERDHVSLADLKDEVFLDIGGAFRQATWEMIKSLCNGVGFDPVKSEKQYSQTENALVALRSQKDGVIITGKDMNCLHFPNIKSLQLDDEPCYRYVSLVYKRSSEHRGIPLFLDCFRSHVGEFGW